MNGPRFRFKNVHGLTVSPTEWLRVWNERYPGEKYDLEHDRLLARAGDLRAVDFEQIGRWKDAANSNAKWQPNAASVAYTVWMHAATVVPRLPADAEVPAFLQAWAEREYTQRFATREVTKRFGLSRATTLLYFLSAGRFPIFDSRVRRAIARLCAASVPNTITGYLSEYRPLIIEIAASCGTRDLRSVDRALFSYGGRGLPGLNEL